MSTDAYTVTFSHALGDKITVKETGVVGYITAQHNSSGNKSREYKAVTYINGNRSEDWYYEWELQPHANA